MARETGGGRRGCGSDSALGRGMTSQNVAQKRGHGEDRRIANRSAISERAAQGNLSQFNSLDLVVPWFGTRRSAVQIHSPRPLISRYIQQPSVPTSSLAMGRAASVFDAKTKKWFSNRECADDIDDAKARAERIARKLVQARRSKRAVPCRGMERDWIKEKLGSQSLAATQEHAAVSAIHPKGMRTHLTLVLHARRLERDIDGD
jgi:hypothetical protein